VLFGSALTDRFDEDRSDVDFLVEFVDEIDSRFDAYFDLKDALDELTGRPVDLVTGGALDNPYFAESIPRNSELYAA
jgi:predicted nucleotidyltransferase